MSQSDLAKAAKTTPVTLKKNLDALKKGGNISVRKDGRSKLWKKASIACQPVNVPATSGRGFLL